MVDIAEWVKREGWKDLGPHDVISQKPAHHVDPFIESVRPLHEAIKEGDPYAAAWAAINAAYRFALIAAQWELCVQDQDTHDMELPRFRKYRKTQARYEKLRQALRKRMEDHPRDSLTYARQQVAKDLGVGERTIIRATQGMTTTPAKKTKRK